jgi:hypothetical protein
MEIGQYRSHVLLHKTGLRGAPLTTFVPLFPGLSLVNNFTK